LLVAGAEMAVRRKGSELSGNFVEFTFATAVEVAVGQRVDFFSRRLALKSFAFAYFGEKEASKMHFEYCRTRSISAARDDGNDRLETSGEKLGQNAHG